MESYLGTQIYFDERNYLNQVRNWDSKAKPAILKLKKTYEDLGISEFDQRVYNEMIQNGISGIVSRFVKAHNKDLKAFERQFKTVAKTFAANDPLESQEVKAFESAFNDVLALTNTPSFGVWDEAIDLSDGRVSLNGVTVDEEKLKARYTNVLDSEEKIKLYSLLQECIKSFNSVRDQLNRVLGEKAKNVGVIQCDLQYEGKYDLSLTRENESGYLDFIPENFIK